MFVQKSTKTDFNTKCLFSNFTLFLINLTHFILFKHPYFEKIHGAFVFTAVHMPTHTHIDPMVDDTRLFLLLFEKKKQQQQMK